MTEHPRSAPSRWQLARSSPWLQFGAVLIFWSAITLLIVVPSVRLDHRFAQQGRRATATVEHKAMKEASGRTSTTYAIAYRFTAADGRAYSASDTVDAELWERLAEGGPVPVEYLASAPATSRLQPGSGRVEVIMLGVSIVAFAGGAVLIWMGLKRLRAGIVPAPGRRTVIVSPGGLQVSTTWTHELPWAGWLERRIPLPVFFGLVLLGVGATFLLVGLPQIRADAAFRARGEEVQGTVVAKGVSEDRAGSGSLRGPSMPIVTHWVQYRFTLPDGRAVNAREEVGRREWNGLHERGPVALRYVPGRTVRSRLAGEGPSMWPYLIAALGGAMAVGALASFGYATARHGRSSARRR